MNSDIQKASVSKRLVAWMFDSMLVVILAVLLSTVISGMLGYDVHSAELEAHYVRIEEKYGVDFDITQEDFEKLSPEAQDAFNKAYEELTTDEDTMYVYNLLISFTIVIVSLSLLVSILLLEFLVPLLFKNGQTLGKKIFGVALMRVDSVKISPVSLFIRTLLGKYTIETMIPVLMGLLMMWGAVGVVAPIFVLGLFAIQIIMISRSENRTCIHDRLAYTVAVDFSSQMIFDSPEAAIAYRESLSKTEAVFQD